MYTWKLFKAPAGVVALCLVLCSLLQSVTPGTSKAMKLPDMPTPASTGQGPLGLGSYPRPPLDNGRGIHWFASVDISEADTDHWIGEAKALHLTWITLLNYYDTTSSRQDYAVQAFRTAGIEPVMRIYTTYNDELVHLDHLSGMVRHYSTQGVHYFELGNEPNGSGWESGWHPGDDSSAAAFVHYWLPTARVVAAAGGLPGFPGLIPNNTNSPNNDLRYLRESLIAVHEQNGVDAFNHAWFAIHNYNILNPPTYLKDSDGFLKFRFYDPIIEGYLGRPLPIISTEGGSTVAPIDPQTQARWTVAMFQYMNHAEPYYFTFMPWLIGNAVVGGNDPRFEQASWYKADGSHLPVVDAVKADSTGSLRRGSFTVTWTSSNHWLPLVEPGGQIYLSKGWSLPGSQQSQSGPPILKQGPAIVIILLYTTQGQQVARITTKVADTISVALPSFTGTLNGYASGDQTITVNYRGPKGESYLAPSIGLTNGQTTSRGRVAIQNAGIDITHGHLRGLGFDYSFTLPLNAGIVVRVHPGAVFFSSDGPVVTL